jgi:hypothetical protein
MVVDEGPQTTFMVLAVGEVYVLPPLVVALILNVYTLSAVPVSNCTTLQSAVEQEAAKAIPVDATVCAIMNSYFSIGQSATFVVNTGKVLGVV